MTNIERLKLELNHKEYFTDAEYTVFLSENDLNSDDLYIKDIYQRQLLYTVIDILESVSNDIDLMRKIETEFATTSEVAKFLEQRIEKLKNRIYSIPSNGTSMATLLFRRTQ